MDDEAHEYTDDDVRLIRERLHILQAIHDALQRWPEVSDVVHSSKSEQQARRRLRELMGFDDVQAQAAMDTQLRRTSEHERERISQQLNKMKDALAGALEQQRRRRS
ncbi:MULTISPECIES: DNA gyrase subunit A [Aeromicrobium]|uniref:DNA gyrase subunit A n=1 Tax=Aeromicrobium TaxID=2040 RepID=UPI00257F2D3D|nr:MULTISPECIES: DNA gyrase subunit A [Aeromicrobium]